MIVYKVVRGKRVFRPATKLALQSVRYYLDHWTEQPDGAGPLAAFRTLEDADEFMAIGNGERVLLCDAEESVETTLYKRNPTEFVRSRYGRGYYTRAGGVTKKLSGFPAGTVFCSRIKPIMEIVPDGTTGSDAKVV